MAYIDVDEPVLEQDYSPVGQVERSHDKTTSKINNLTGRKKLTYSVVAVVTLLVVIQLFRLNSEAKRLEQQVAGQSTSEQIVADAEGKKLATEVGQYLDLPDEVPTVATVSDANKVNNQAFFARSQNGDKVLLYEQAKRAVLYRPSTKKVIEFASLN